jgi:hypothetical protein
VKHGIPSWLTDVLPILLALVVGFVAYKIGKRWRSQYGQAVAHHNDLHAENTAQASVIAELQSRAAAAATASGNVVVIGDGSSGVGAGGVIRDTGSESPGIPELGPVGVVRHGLDSGADSRAALNDGDPSWRLDDRIPELAELGDGRPDE